MVAHRATAERLRAAALEEETVRRCCVLVPLIELPQGWMMGYLDMTSA